MRLLMQPALLLCLMLGAVLSGAARDADEAVDVDACVAAATADWSPPRTLAEASALQEALAEIVAGCGAEAEAETEGAEEGLSDADSDFPRTMYVTSRVPRINVRRNASTSSAIVTTLAHAAPVEALGRAQGESYRGNEVWLRVGAGYVHSVLLGETKPAPLPTPAPVTAPQDDQPPQQQQDGRQRQAGQPPSEGQTPPDEVTRPDDDDTNGQPPVVQPTPAGPLIFVPLTEDEWKKARRRLFGEDG